MTEAEFFKTRRIDSLHKKRQIHPYAAKRIRDGIHQQVIMHYEIVFTPKAQEDVILLQKHSQTH